MDVATHRPMLSSAGLRPTLTVTAVDEYGEPREGCIVGERPLTLYLDKREVVTLMTLGMHPTPRARVSAEPAAGAPPSRRLPDRGGLDVGAAAVSTSAAVEDLDERLSHRTVTTAADRARPSAVSRTARLHPRDCDDDCAVALYALLDALRDRTRSTDPPAPSTAVPCAALRATARHAWSCSSRRRRHNAADAIAGTWRSTARG